MGFPERAQLGDHARGERHATILAALAQPDVQPQLRGINVGDLDFDGFTHAQPAVINQAQTDAEPFLAQTAQRAPHLLAREHQRQRLRRGG